MTSNVSSGMLYATVLYVYLVLEDRVLSTFTLGFSANSNGDCVLIFPRRLVFT